jgi:hypothetical protein
MNATDLKELKEYAILFFSHHRATSLLSYKEIYENYADDLLKQINKIVFNDKLDKLINYVQQNVAINEEHESLKNSVINYINWKRSINSPPAEVYNTVEEYGIYIRQLYSDEHSMITNINKPRNTAIDDTLTLVQHREDYDEIDDARTKKLVKLQTKLKKSKQIQKLLQPQQQLPPPPASPNKKVKVLEQPKAPKAPKAPKQQQSPRKKRAEFKNEADAFKMILEEREKGTTFEDIFDKITKKFPNMFKTDATMKTRYRSFIKTQADAELRQRYLKITKFRPPNEFQPDFEVILNAMEKDVKMVDMRDSLEKLKEKYPKVDEKVLLDLETLNKNNEYPSSKTIYNRISNYLRNKNVPEDDELKVRYKKIKELKKFDQLFGDDYLLLSNDDNDIMEHIGDYDYDYDYDPILGVTLLSSDEEEGLIMEDADEELIMEDEEDLTMEMHKLSIGMDNGLAYEDEYHSMDDEEDEYVNPPFTFKPAVFAESRLTPEVKARRERLIKSKKQSTEYKNYRAKLPRETHYKINVEESTPSPWYKDSELYPRTPRIEQSRRGFVATYNKWRYNLSRWLLIDNTGNPIISAYRWKAGYRFRYKFRSSEIEFYNINKKKNKKEKKEMVMVEEEEEEKDNPFGDDLASDF